MKLLCCSLLLLLPLLQLISVAISYRVPVHISNEYGPIMSVRVGKPSVELNFKVNFTHDRCSIGVDMYGRSTTFSDLTQVHTDSNSLIGTELFRTGPTLTRMAL